MKTARFFITLAIAASLARAESTPLIITAGKSQVIDSPADVQRVSVGTGEILEAVAVSAREILLNGKAPGETTLVIWRQDGGRSQYDVKVTPSSSKYEAVMREVARELPGQDISMSVEEGTVFVRGTAKDLVSSDRAVMMAGTLGKPVNLLQVTVPDVEPQILLKVRFANIDRTLVSELGANFFSTGAGNTPGSISTGQFNPPTPKTISGQGSTFNITDALNVFLFRPDLNLGATIRALQSRKLLEILAEPNLLAMNGKQASFLAGGEYPYPVAQGGAGYTTVTIQFREFGVRINFIPTITPRGTIRLQVAPEVSSLDFTNGLVYQGFNIPALAVRRVNTEVELASGQSFALAGLLDNRATETLSKIPGLGDVPVLGKLFQSRAISRNHSELLVIITPELVRPIPPETAGPELQMPVEFMKDGAQTPPRTPGLETTGPVPVTPAQSTVPAEQWAPKSSNDKAAPPQVFQMVPLPVAAPASNGGLQR